VCRESSTWHAASKREAVALYAALSGDTFSALVGDTYQRCKHAWHYGISSATGDRGEMGALCGRVLTFEEAALRLCVGYLHAVLDVDGQGDERMRALAAEMLSLLDRHSE
jgi:hypothetical protein